MMWSHFEVWCFRNYEAGCEVCYFHRTVSKSGTQIETIHESKGWEIGQKLK